MTLYEKSKNIFCTKLLLPSVVDLFLLVSELMSKMCTKKIGTDKNKMKCRVVYTEINLILFFSKFDFVLTVYQG